MIEGIPKNFHMGPKEEGKGNHPNVTTRHNRNSYAS